MQNIFDFSLGELKQQFESFGEKPYRAKQLLEHLYKNKNFEKVNLGADLKQKILQNFVIGGIKIKQVFKSEKTNTQKFLFELCDGNFVEGVLMSYHYGNTACLSTQVGCKMGCKFCTSGKNGMLRNLTVGEILEMLIIINGASPVKNVVLMGSGEPLDNFDNVVKFLNIATSPDGLNMSARSISLSTCGLVPKIYELVDKAPKVTLSISLHASNDEARKKIMKVAQAYTISDTLKAAKYYFQKTGRRIAIEYTLVKNINSKLLHADELAKKLKNLTCFVNLIMLNGGADSGLEPIKKSEAFAFCERLKSHGISASIRRTLGDDIEGACGQLRAKFVGDSDTSFSGKKDN